MKNQKISYSTEYSSHILQLIIKTMMRKRTSAIIIILLIILPILLWFLFKPIRIFAPELAWVTCPNASVCLDDISKIKEATELRAEAITFVNSKIGTIQAEPRMIFCSTKSCDKSFGFTSNAAYNFGTFGLVISSRGWKPYFLRHELIHHLQNEQLGSLRAWILKPTWFREGMAYRLSEDPRKPLTQPFEEYRNTFDWWFSEIDPTNLWVEADKL